VKMNVDPENFEALKKLLSLKRLEQPPPGYFDRLAGRIADRIEMGEGESSFWERLAANFTIRPAFAYGLALSVCCAFAGATIYSFKTEATHADSQLATIDDWRSVNPAVAAETEETRGFGLHVANWTPRTNLAAEPVPAHSLFEPTRLVAVPAAYHGN